MKFKKSVVSIAFGLTALASASASAFTENLEFNGVILNSNPVWEWEVDSDATTGAKDIVLDISAATSNGANLEWAMPKFDNQAIIKGHLPGVLAVGIPGMEPMVSFNGVDVTSATETNLIEVSVDANGNGSKVGAVTLAVTGAGWIKRTDANGEVQGIAVEQGNAELTAWAKTTVTTINTNQETLIESTGSWAEFTAGYSSATVTDATAAVGYASKSATLSFPSSQVPTTWAATLPITIALN